MYPHPNPLRKTGAALDSAASDKDFFNSLQFPIGYNFEQDEGGLVSRTFAEQSFKGGETLYDRVFSLVNKQTGNALSLVDCNATPRIVVEKYNKERILQQFKLNPHDQLESTACAGKVISLLGPNPFECMDGVGLSCVHDAPLHDDKNKWRFYENGIVNLACGRANGNLAVTVVEDDSFDLLYLDDIQFSIVNPFNGLAIGIGQKVSMIVCL